MRKTKQVMWAVIIIYLFVVCMLILVTWLDPPRKIYRPVFNKEIIEAADNTSRGVN